MNLRDKELRNIFPHQMLAAVRKVGSKVYVMRADTGEDITKHVPLQLRDKALQKSKGLRFIHTSTGGIQWRNHDANLVQEVMDDNDVVWEADQMKADSRKNPSDETHIRDILTNAIDYRPDDLVMDDVRWRYLVRSILRGKVILMVGPSGCGKSKAAYSASKAFASRKFFNFSLGASQDARGMLIGNTHFEEGVGTIVKKSEFVQAIQTENAIIFLDEASRDLSGDATNILMTVMDTHHRYLRIDEDIDTPKISVADGVTFILAANQGNQYTAANVLDRALLGRCNVIIEMDPMSQKDELELLKLKHSGCNGDMLKLLRAITQIAEASRDEMKSDDPKINTIIDTRQVEQMAELVYDGFSLEEIAEVCVYPFYPEEGGLDSPRTFMRQVVQAKIPTDLDGKNTPWSGGSGAATAKMPGGSADVDNKVPWDEDDN